MVYFGGGSVSDAPIDGLWELEITHLNEGNKIHPDIKNFIVEKMRQHVGTTQTYWW